MVQKILHQLTLAQYPTRPNKAKCSWIEPVQVEGTWYILSCSIDEDTKNIVVSYIKPKKQ